MRLTFFDRQDAANPLNGEAIDTLEALRSIINSLRGRRPFLAELLGPGGHKLLLGLGAGDGCVQFSRTDGEPPYLMAMGSLPSTDGEKEFLIGDTATPISIRYCLPMQSVVEIACHFFDTGERSPRFEWEEV